MLKKIFGKKEPTQDRPTIINVLLDDSGSMGSWRDVTISGYNTYIDTLRSTDKEVDVCCTLTKFGNQGHYSEVYQNMRIDQVPYLNSGTYNPGSGTDINWAIKRCIKETEKLAKSRGGNPNVVVVLQSDGEDSADSDVGPLIKAKQKEGWVFIFMGCGRSVEGYALGIGLKKENISYYSGQKTVEAFENMAKNTIRYVHSGDATDTAYTEEQRKRQS